jgi:hypothetical protein
MDEVYMKLLEELSELQTIMLQDMNKKKDYSKDLLDELGDVTYWLDRYINRLSENESNYVLSRYEYKEMKYGKLENDIYEVRNT